MNKINNWEYKLVIKYNEIVSPNVTPDIEIAPPTTLSKYYSLSKYSVDSFLKQQFYVSQPSDLNDLFDHNLAIADYSNFNFSDFSLDYENEADRKDAEDLYKRFRLLYLNRIRNTQYEVWTSRYGILCLTEKTTNELMWAHYTSNSGFLLEFNHHEFDGKGFLGPFPINYLPQLKKIDFNNLEIGIEKFGTSKFLNTFLGFSIASLIKKDIWNYEREYRYLCLPENDNLFSVKGARQVDKIGYNIQERFIAYPRSSLKRIILGFNFYTDNILPNNSQMHEYEVSFNDEKADLKISIFNKIIKDKIKVELCIQDINNFELKTIPIEIRHNSGVNYNVKEIR